MRLAPGTRVGPYEITAPLGAGGMGEVYRARDANLRRDVAIKVLLASVADDPDRLARFAREAQLLASLNHPHIAQIYGVEEAGGIRALVMELLKARVPGDGESGADKRACPFPCPWFGGEGAFVIDWLTALEQWAHNGKTPDALPAFHPPKPVSQGNIRGQALR